MDMDAALLVLQLLPQVLRKVTVVIGTLTKVAVLVTAMVAFGALGTRIRLRLMTYVSDPTQV